MIPSLLFPGTLDFHKCKILERLRLTRLDRYHGEMERYTNHMAGRRKSLLIWNIYSLLPSYNFLHFHYRRHANLNDFSLQYCSVHSLSCVWLFVTPWTEAHHASLSITNSQSLLKLSYLVKNFCYTMTNSTLVIVIQWYISYYIEEIMDGT